MCMGQFVHKAHRPKRQRPRRVQWRPALAVRPAARAMRRGVAANNTSGHWYYPGTIINWS